MSFLEPPHINTPSCAMDHQVVWGVVMDAGGGFPCTPETFHQAYKGKSAEKGVTVVGQQFSSFNGGSHLLQRKWDSAPFFPIPMFS